MKNKPSYAIESVDHALQLAQVLQEGPLRVTDAAERLGVSRSTAHRLLSMLVYRGFARQSADRRYHRGPALQPAGVGEAPVAVLRRVALPHLQALMSRARETVNLLVLTGTDMRFIATVECNQVLRVGDRAGQVLPAHITSGGKAVLAAMPPQEVDSLLKDAEDVDLTRLRHSLRLVRRRGFAINEQATEKGLTAIGRAVLDRAGNPVAAIALALPSCRFDRAHLPGWVDELAATVTAIEADLAA